MYYYHVISDVPKYQGEHILLDERHPNGVHKRVYSQLDVVKDIYQNPQRYSGMELSHETDVALRELALEKIRREKYPQYPSRLASLYVSKTYSEAKRWGEYFVRLGRLFSILPSQPFYFLPHLAHHRVRPGNADSFSKRDYPAEELAADCHFYMSEKAAVIHR